MCATLSTGRVMLALLLCVSGLATAQKKSSSPEQDLMDAVNRERKERELPILKWDEGLALAARKHAELMAEHRVLEHRLPDEPELAVRAYDAGARFSHITENIGVAEWANAFHEGWMNSPGHRANILDPRIDSIGIGMVDGEQQLYAVEDFALAVEPLSIEEQQERVGAVLVSRGLKLLNIGDAKKFCDPNEGIVGSRRPGYLARYETVNISQLPEDLERQVHLPRFKAAVVVACPQKEGAGFTRFRIIVVLY